METKFSRNIKTHMKPDQLWKQLLAGIQNSEGHPFWPTHLEESRAEEIKPNANIHVNYKFFVKGKPVTYKITKVDEVTHHFSYKTTDSHPLNGHADIKVYPNNSGGSTLRWEGVYKYPWYSPAGLFLRSIFLNMFFSELNDGIHKFEKEASKTVSTQPATAH